MPLYTNVDYFQPLPVAYNRVNQWRCAPGESCFFDSKYSTRNVTNCGCNVTPSNMVHWFMIYYDDTFNSRSPYTITFEIFDICYDNGTWNGVSCDCLPGRAGKYCEIENIDISLNFLYSFSIGSGERTQRTFLLPPSVGFIGDITSSCGSNVKYYSRYSCLNQTTEFCKPFDLEGGK